MGCEASTRGVSSVPEREEEDWAYVSVRVDQQRAGLRPLDAEPGRSVAAMSDPRIVAGNDLPALFHHGRHGTATWIRAADRLAEERALGVKPTGVLWTAPRIWEDAAGHVATAWSEVYFGRGYDAERRARRGAARRVLDVWSRERQWPVVASGAARVVRLESIANLREAASRWPAPHGRISFEAMARDGIDGVWVRPAVLPGSWSEVDRQSADAALRGQFYGWEVESVVWLRPDHLTVGRARPVARFDRVPAAQLPEVQGEADRSADAARDAPSAAAVTPGFSAYRAAFPTPAARAVRDAPLPATDSPGVPAASRPVRARDVTDRSR